ncbi:MAG: type II secretion system F family protein [Spirochaetaceae bacterium]|jgi:general secretion pathway protein F|nr:type II secretion system F family protein [Spirochaetaceae bacterium]
MKVPLHFYENLLALLEGNLSISGALQVISETTGDRLAAKTANDILSSMKQGYSFYETASGYLLSYQKPILQSAEVTGDLKSAIASIIADLYKKEKAKENIVGALIYPAIIIMASIAGTVFLLVKGIPLFAQSGLMSVEIVSNAVQGVISAGMFLLVAGIAFVFTAFKLFGNDSPRTQVFYLLSVLTGHHISLSDALYYCIEQCSQTKALVLIKKDIEAGIRVSDAFSAQKKLCTPFVQNWLAIADNSGNLTEAFKSIYIWCIKTDEKRRSLATRFIEPVAIIITGIYLLLLLQAVVLPILTRTGGVL